MDSMSSPNRAKFLATMALVCGGCLTASVMMFGVSEVRYAFGSRTVDATIEELESLKLRRQKSFITQTSHTAVYQFAWPGEATPRKGRGELSPGRFKDLKIGDRLPVQVIEAQPSVNRPLEPDPWMGPILFALGALGLGLLLFGAKRYRRAVPR